MCGWGRVSGGGLEGIILHLHLNALDNSELYLYIT